MARVSVKLYPTSTKVGVPNRSSPTPAMDWKAAYMQMKPSVNMERNSSSVKGTVLKRG